MTERSASATLARNWPALVAATAMAAASLALAPGIAGLLGAALALLAVAIAVADARRYIIPDELTLAAVLLGLVHAGVEAPSGARVAPLGLAAARGIFLAAAFFSLREAYWRLRKRQGLGLGDVKLSAAAGVWLDVDFIAIAIEIAALAAIATYLLRQYLLRRPISATAPMPFGLFLAPSIWLAWLAEAVLASL